MNPSLLTRAARALGRRLVISPEDGSLQAIDGLPLPDAAQLEAALEAARARRVMTPDEFRALFTPHEVHAIFRRGTLTSETAVQVANAWARFTTAREIHSDHPEVGQALALFEAAGILTAERRARIASGLPPEEAVTS